MRPGRSRRLRSSGPTGVEDAERLASHFVLTVDDDKARDIWGPAAAELLAALFLAAHLAGTDLAGAYSSCCVTVLAQLTAGAFGTGLPYTATSILVAVILGCQPAWGRHPVAGPRCGTAPTAQRHCRPGWCGVGQAGGRGALSGPSVRAVSGSGNRTVNVVGGLSSTVMLPW